MNYKPYIDNDELQKSFGFCMDIDKTFRVHLCLYSINEFQITQFKEKQLEHSTIPYVKYIVEKKDTVAFPFFEYRCPIINEVHSDALPPPPPSQLSGPQMGGNEVTDENEMEKETGTDEKNHFETEIYKEWLKVYMDTTGLHNLNMNFNEVYKGYIEMGDSNSDLFVFINVDTTDFPLKENMIFVTLDEMLFKKSVLSVPVDEKIPRLFKTHPELMYMKTETDAEIPIPFQLYMCKIEDGLYTTIQSSYTEYIYPLEHGIFGPGYVLTSESLGEKDTFRFICHIDKCLYVLEPLDDIKTNKMVSIKETSSVSTCVYFHENETQLWLIRGLNYIHKL